MYKWIVTETVLRKQFNCVGGNKGCSLIEDQLGYT